MVILADGSVGGVGCESRGAYRLGTLTHVSKLTFSAAAADSYHPSEGCSDKFVTQGGGQHCDSIRIFAFRCCSIRNMAVCGRVCMVSTTMSEILHTRPLTLRGFLDTAHRERAEGLPAKLTMVWFGHAVREVG